MAVQLVYETHSITVDNERGVATGWLPGQLSARGRELAAELGRRRRSDGISAVFVSDLTRALETAAIAFEGSGIPVYIDSRLRECDFGEWNGTPIAVLEPQRRNHLDVPWPGGESYRRAVGRTGTFLADLARDWDGRRVLVIAHAAQRRALQHIVDGIPLEDLVEAPFDWREGWEYRL
jgi:2,3-bisphosphoglycerate-dependent phosphoglycerate mutase